MSENQAQEQKITLTLNPQEEAQAEAEKQPEVKEEEQPAQGKTLEQQMDDAHLSPEERKVVNDFAKKIDITNSGTVLEYGSAAQKKVSDFSDTALNNVSTKDLGEIGDMLTNLVTELKDYDKDTQEKRHIDCGCCGYDSCREMAIAVFNGFNHPHNCVHFIKDRAYEEKDK